MTRWRRPGAGELLLFYLVLATAGATLGLLSHSYRAPQPLWSFPLAAFLTWRVSRGGQVSHALLFVSSAAAYGLAALTLARAWDRTVVALLVLGAAQLAVLLSPPVAARMGYPQPAQASADGWAQLLRRPPGWLLPSALLAGVLATLACLGHMAWVPAPGCTPAASESCMALAEGYPLRWLTADQGVPVISKAALLRDCAQWALVCLSVLYLAWLWLMPPARPRLAEAGSDARAGAAPSS